MLCLYESTSFDPYENLAIEEYLMNTLPKGTCCLMLWQNAPCVIVGKNQIAAEEINESFVRKKGILTARRNSGGGAVYQDKGNLNYSVIEDMASEECSSSKTEGRDPDLRILQNSFYRYMRPVLYAMKQFGVPAEITGRNDIAVGGRKVSGSAQFCRSGKVLHHGCILITTDLDALCSSLRVNSSKYQTRGIRSVKSRVAALCEFTDRPISTEEFKEQLIFSFGQAFSEGAYMPAVTEKGFMQRILLTVAYDGTDFHGFAFQEGVRTVLEAEGRIDVLINNAGYGFFGAVENVPLEEARRQLEVNVFGLARLCQLVLPVMRSQGSGRIINTSSVAGKAVLYYGGWYHVSKFSVEALSDALRMEMKPFGIDVVLIEPGGIRTDWGHIAGDHLAASSEGTVYAQTGTCEAENLHKAYSSPFLSHPSVVTRAILRAVESRRPRVRYRPGRGASLIVGSHALLPARWWDALMRQMGRIRI